MECKINPDHIRPAGIEAFRGLYPQGRNLILSPNVKQPYRVRHQAHTLTVCDTRDLSQLLDAPVRF